MLGIALYIHNDQVEVTQGHFTDKGSDIYMTRLVSGMSFLQVKSSMTMKEKLWQMKSARCANRRDITRTWLETEAGVDNPYRQYLEKIT